MPDAHLPAQLMNSKEVCRLAAVSPATLWRMVKARRFPQPIKLAPQVTRWRADEVAAHLDGLSEAREPA